MFFFTLLTQKGVKVMPTSVKGWAMFAASVLIVVVVTKKVEFINKYVGL